LRAAEGDLQPKLQPWRWLAATTVSVDNCRGCAAWWGICEAAAGWIEASDVR
jgi:hypothetical protein